MNKAVEDRAAGRPIIFLAAALGLSLVLAAGLAASLYRTSKGAGPTGVKEARFNMTTRAVVTDVPPGARVLDLWMPYPQSGPNQFIRNVKVKSPYPVEVNHEKEYGNKILHVRVKDPKKDFIVAVDFDATRLESRVGDFEKGKVGETVDVGDFANFMRYDRVGALTPLLSGLSNKLTRGKKDNVSKAKAIYDYMAKTYIYDFDKKSLPATRGDLAVFCQTKKGRCTELSTLFATLARAAGIPVKYVSGYTLRNHDSGEVGGHCCWVEFWAAGRGWIPADLATAKKFPKDAEYYFGNMDEWRVELVTGRDLLLEPPQKGERINAWIDPYAEVDGKPFTVGKRVSWIKKK